MWAASRYHGIRPADFQKLAWWEQRIISEGLMAEQPWIYRTAMAKDAKDPLRDRFRSQSMAEDSDDMLRSLQNDGVKVRSYSVSAK